MGVDYLARKAKKANRKKSGQALEGRTFKKTVRRKLRGDCYQSPDLHIAKDPEEEELEEDKEPRRKTAPKSKIQEEDNAIPPPTINITNTIPEHLQSYPPVFQTYLTINKLTHPTAVQSACWPPLLSKRNCLVIAPPGQGKTLGYLLPIASLLIDRGHCAATHPPGPIALVLLPARELAQQVAAVARSVCKARFTANNSNSSNGGKGGLRVECVTGGSDIQTQVDALEWHHPHVLVSTPGRLLDLIEKGAVQLDKLRYVVLDEADKLLNMGFQPQIQQVWDMLQNNKKPPQIALFTATMPTSLEAAANVWLTRPQKIRITTTQLMMDHDGSGDGNGINGSGHATSTNNGGGVISDTVTQIVHVCAQHKKPQKLQKHLASIKAESTNLRNPPRVLIFTNRIKTARFVFNEIKKSSFRVTILHGERSQEEREAALADFRSGKAQVLVATDVAARGLHIAGLPYVVNYDFPSNLETYVHRVGRTGRLAADGHAYSFLTREAAALAGPVLKLLQQHNSSSNSSGGVKKSQVVIDPNLVKLSEAYQIAYRKLAGGGDAEEEEKEKEEHDDVGHGDKEKKAKPSRDDILLELGMDGKRKKKRKVQQKKEVNEEDDDSRDDDDDDDEGKKVEPSMKKPTTKKSVPGNGNGTKKLLPGQLWRQQVGKASSSDNDEEDGDGDGDGSDVSGNGGDEEVLASKPMPVPITNKKKGKQQRKSLPGRLRKKLAAAKSKSKPKSK